MDKKTPSPNQSSMETNKEEPVEPPMTEPSESATVTEWITTDEGKPHAFVKSTYQTTEEAKSKANLARERGYTINDKKIDSVTIK